MSDRWLRLRHEGCEGTLIVKQYDSEEINPTETRFFFIGHCDLCGVERKLTATEYV